MSRIGSLLLVLLLVVALVITLNPQVRSKDVAAVQIWQLDSKIVVNAPSINTPVVIASTPLPTATPVAEADQIGDYYRRIHAISLLGQEQELEIAKRLGHDWGDPSAEAVWDEFRGLAPAFRKAGFTEAARRSKTDTMITTLRWRASF